MHKCTEKINMPGFLVNFDEYEIASEYLTAEAAGSLIKALLKYGVLGERSLFEESLMDFLFDFYSKRIDSYGSKYKNLEISSGIWVYYYDFYSFFDPLTDEEAGMLFEAVAEYAKAGKETTFEDRLLKIAFAFFKAKIDDECLTCQTKRDLDSEYFVESCMDRER